jgi:hypothetical protein
LPYKDRGIIEIPYNAWRIFAEAVWGHHSQATLPPAPAETEPEKAKSVGDIIRAYLKANGYDGLCNDDCGCGMDDLAPCDRLGLDCEIAVKHYCDKCRKKDTCDSYAKDGGSCYAPAPEESGK